MMAKLFKGGSTSVLIKHLGGQHGITRAGRVPTAERQRKKSRRLRRKGQQIGRSQAPMRRCDVFRFVDMPLDLSAVVARLAARDNLSFSTIAESQMLRLLIELYTAERLPRSPNTIKRIIYDVSDLKRRELSVAFERYQRCDGTFALVFDEATASNSLHRYMSLNVRTESLSENDQGDAATGPDFYLGLILVEDSLTADRIAEAIRARLALFKIAMENCYFATTDGAANMRTAVIVELGLQSQLCIVHGLQVVLGEVVTRRRTLTEQLVLEMLMDMEGQKDHDAVSDGETSVSTESSNASTADLSLPGSESDEGNCNGNCKSQFVMAISGPSHPTLKETRIRSPFLLQGEQGAGRNAPEYGSDGEAN